MFKSIKLIMLLLVGMLLFAGCGGSSDSDDEEITIDTTPPVITIIGDNPLEVTQGETFLDPGAIAKDDRDGTVIVTPSGTVEMDTKGSYQIIYVATDTAGNKATAKRTVIVKSAEVIWKVSDIEEFRQALENSATNGESDRIILAKGTYNVTSDALGTLTFDDNEEFNLTIEAQKGLNPKDVILNGNNATQVFNFNNKINSTLILKNISVVDGNSSSKGGGIYSNQNIKIENCNLSKNNTNGSASHGGAFYSNGTTTITNSTLSNNNISGSSSYGGAFYSNGTTTVTNSTISNNNVSAYSSYGGAFYSNGATIVTNSTISNNSSMLSGGGFHSGATIVTNSIISNNYSTHGAGGGFYSQTAIVTNSTISNNRSADGGGFYSYYGSTVTNSIFIENNATSGATFSSCTVITASSYVSNSNFIGNKGSIHAKGIFVNNIFDSNDEDISLRGDSKIYNNYVDYSKIEDNGHNVLKKKNLQFASVGEVYLNNDNKRLASNSPVINKGLNPSSATYKDIIDNDTVYNQILEFLKIDMIGHKRVHNGTIDMGAVEYY